MHDLPIAFVSHVMVASNGEAIYTPFLHHPGEVRDGVGRMRPGRTGVFNRTWRRELRRHFRGDPAGSARGRWPVAPALVW